MANPRLDLRLVYEHNHLGEHRRRWVDGGKKGDTWSPQAVLYESEASGRCWIATCLNRGYDDEAISDPRSCVEQLRDHAAQLEALAVFIEATDAAEKIEREKAAGIRDSYGRLVRTRRKR